MATATVPPWRALPEAMPALFRFSVEQYLAMAGLAAFQPEVRTELIEGLVVEQMDRSPRHDAILCGVLHRLAALRLTRWLGRCRSALILGRSVAEPDIAIVRGPDRAYIRRHPGSADAALIVEVADSSLVYDREEKGPLYAQDGVREYWVVNVVDRQVEVYTQPTAGERPGYRGRRDYVAGEAVPFVLEGHEVARLDVTDFFAGLAAG
jgi:Uma2 family endonuclease